MVLLLCEEILFGKSLAETCAWRMSGYKSVSQPFFPVGISGFLMPHALKLCDVSTRVVALKSCMVGVVLKVQSVSNVMTLNSLGGGRLGVRSGCFDHHLDIKTIMEWKGFLLIEYLHPPQQSGTPVLQ